MLKEKNVPENQKTLVVKKYDVTANGKYLGDISVLKNGNVVATASRSGFESVKAAEKWLTHI